MSEGASRAESNAAPSQSFELLNIDPAIIAESLTLSEWRLYYQVGHPLLPQTFYGSAHTNVDTSCNVS